MLFNSYEFLFAFLPLVLAVYYLLRANRARLVFLTLASYLFYGWWDYRFCGLMLFTTTVDYLVARMIHGATTLRARRGWLAVSIFADLSVLGFFKYFDLLAGTINRAASAFAGAPQVLLPILHIILPVGISFYTFQSMSYTIDVYRRAAQPAPSFWNFACFVSLFPQLVAGPIVRYHDLAAQLVQRTHSCEKAAAGISFFIMGLAKKVVLADSVVPFVDTAFRSGAPGFADAWVGIIAYAMQIYYDFSGYSDMAVGLGLMLGFQFPQNFNSPYKAGSITEFWRRWHISLSTWLRDYLYIPLGGNRHGPWRTYGNLLLTMLLGGLWHGANWTFLFWGGFHGTLLALERAVGKRSLCWWAPVWAQRAFTFGLVLIAWVFFRAGGLGVALNYLAGMLGLHGWGEGAARVAREAPWSVILLGCCLILTWCAPNSWELMGRSEHKIQGAKPGSVWEWCLGSRIKALAAALALCGLLVFCVGVILVNSSSPFLYFQF